MDKLASLLHTTPAIVWMVLKVVIVFAGVMSLAAIFTWVERRGSAMIQDRIGPNRAALFGKIRIIGLAQILADGIKMFFKEDLIPTAANRGLFFLAPFLAFVPALLGFAVIPFGKDFVSGGVTYHLSVLDPGNGMGMLYPLAIGGMAVYGVLVAAWSSNNKWSILGGMRSSAAMVSYEIGMSLAVVSIFMTAGGYDPSEIIRAQEGTLWKVLPNWNVFHQPLGFIVFFTCMFAETNRLPFDFAEGESEIVAGFNTEFGSMKYSLMALAEYSHMMTASALIATLYFGGWQVPFVKDPSVLLSVACFVVKLVFFAWVFVWIRWTVPRFRYDQLMKLGWKRMLPLSMVNLVFHAWRMSQGH
ncbi:MAG: NADH-quinone oxidoreductase subunit NuoH [Geothrix sp.]|uniref:NADH-quinone oxidoreductase subunit NuoH n=1 Tax=Geothrix sp. TaxID=1962974 RepID=UPI00179D5778|nr:NADH-quinone oxidoreductase subunit NuoH [Geothrix sp.]NWJ40684.1 NADH-quinone oxidoreductase subunit NuoH [Geothrix sp.]WIL21308.1 MAG: NADH-quinone oxidoreductase subunit NuoH [Geothrix sp.]